MRSAACKIAVSIVPSFKFVLRLLALYRCFSLLGVQSGADLRHLGSFFNFPAVTLVSLSAMKDIQS